MALHYNRLTSHLSTCWATSATWRRSPMALSSTSSLGHQETTHSARRRSLTTSHCSVKTANLTRTWWKYLRRQNITFQAHKRTKQTQNGSTTESRAEDANSCPLTESRLLISWSKMRREKRLQDQTTIRKRIRTGVVRREFRVQLRWNRPQISYRCSMTEHVMQEAFQVTSTR